MHLLSEAERVWRYHLQLHGNEWRVGTSCERSGHMGGKVRASHEVRASIEVEDLTGQPTRPGDVDGCLGNLLRRAGASRRHAVHVVPLNPGDVPDVDREGAITHPGAMALTCTLCRWPTRPTTADSPDHQLPDVLRQRRPQSPGQVRRASYAITLTSMSPTFAPR